MRKRAFLGAAITLATVVAWHRWPDDPALGRSTFVSQCSRTGGGPLCKIARGLDASTRHPPTAFSIVGRRPPSDVTGATDPHVAPPPHALTDPLKRRMMAMQHPDERLADYELDHLIPISLGGALLDARNLWLQPRHGQAKADSRTSLHSGSCASFVSAQSYWRGRKMRSDPTGSQPTKATRWPRTSRDIVFGSAKYLMRS